MLQRCKNNSTDVRLEEFRQRSAHFEIRPKEERAEQHNATIVRSAVSNRTLWLAYVYVRAMISRDDDRNESSERYSNGRSIVSLMNVEDLAGALSSLNRYHGKFSEMIKEGQNSSNRFVV